MQPGFIAVNAKVCSDVLFIKLKARTYKHPLKAGSNKRNNKQIYGELFRH